MSLKVFAGRASKILAEQICNCLEIQLGKNEITFFADGEFEVRFEENIRGDDVFIIQSTYSPTENLMELLCWIRAAKGAAAKSVSAVIPYFGWARQDRKPRSRVPITARLVADLIVEAGADHVLTLDLHAAQIQGFFPKDVPVDHLYTRPVFIEFFKQRFNPDEFTIVAPDAGAGKWAEAYAQRLNNRPVAVGYKTRSGPNKAEVLKIDGDFEGKNILIIDDILDTGSTIISAAELLRKRGAGKILAFCSHGLFSGNAISKLDKSPIDQLFITNSIPLRKFSPKIYTISIAPLLAEAIRRSYNNESISSLFE